MSSQMLVVNKMLGARVLVANEVDDIGSGSDKLIEKLIESKNGKLSKA